MTSKLRIIPLGGLGEIGKNMTVIEFGNDLLLIDCGMGFPDEDMYGIDVVLPDITYLRNNASRIRGLIITHGHEDHIGAVPYVLKELDVPIYTTPLTAALIELKLEEHDLLYNTQIFTKRAGSVFRIGCFSIEFIRVNHSIPDAVALAIKTPVGTIVHTGDFKIDLTPISGGMIDLVRFGELGNEGVLALMSDSTNVETPGHSASERKVGESFDKLFQNCDKRIIITTFASNVHRLQQIINVAAKYHRKVAVTGRSMENVLRTAMVLGYMEVPEGVLMDLEQIKSQPKNRTVIISTGSQGEAMSALYRMAFAEHKQIQIDSGDRVIISASAIPGNENTISRVIDLRQTHRFARFRTCVSGRTENDFGSGEAKILYSCTWRAQDAGQACRTRADDGCGAQERYHRRERQGDRVYEEGCSLRGQRASRSRSGRRERRDRRGWQRSDAGPSQAGRGWHDRHCDDLFLL